MIAEKVEKYFNTTVKELIENYDRLGLRSSGRYARELKVVITKNGSKINAKITGPVESIFMEQGRGPNKDKSHKSVQALGHILEQWVKDKGIDVNPYAAAHKIVNKGITVPNPHNKGGVISDIINDEWKQGLTDMLRFDVIKGIKSDVLTAFKAQ